MRAAAKNHARVTVVSDPSDYPTLVSHLKATFAGTGIPSVPLEFRQQYALKAFTQTADYDVAISGYYRKQYAGHGDRQLDLRYGANPHQKPAQVYSLHCPLPIKGRNLKFCILLTVQCLRAHLGT